MIVLDTNVVSEAMRARPSASVMQWIGDQVEPLAVTSITLGELLTGIWALPHGKRRIGLQTAVEDGLVRFGVVLPYDDAAARIYAAMRERSRTLGRGLSVEDGMIASICAAHGATLATRNIVDFDFLGIELLDPWDPPRPR